MAITSIWLRLFHSSSTSVPLRTTTTSGDDNLHNTTPCTSVMIFMETTSIRVRLFYSLSISVPLRTTTASRDDHLQDGTPCACVMIFMKTTSIWQRLFYSSSISVPLGTTSRTGYDHQHDRTPCTSVMIFMETTSIWLLLFYCSSVSVPLRSTNASGRKMNFNKRNFGWTLNRWREHDFIPKTKFYAIVKITINRIARNFVRDRHLDVSLKLELVQSTITNCHHTDQCMKKNTVGHTTTLPGTPDTPDSQGTAGTANPP